MSNFRNKDLEELTAPVCAAHGVELVDVRQLRERGGSVVRVIIDRPLNDDRMGSAVSVEDCALVSRDLSAALEVHEEIIPGAYRLEVSSPGLERPLVKLEDFNRFTGREAKIKTREKIAERRSFQGELLGVVQDQVQLKDDGGEIAIPYGTIAKAHLVYRF